MKGRCHVFFVPHSADPPSVGGSAAIPRRLSYTTCSAIMSQLTVSGLQPVCVRCGPVRTKAGSCPVAPPYPI